MSLLNYRQSVKSTPPWAVVGIETAAYVKALNKIYSCCSLHGHFGGHPLASTTK